MSNVGIGLSGLMTTSSAIDTTSTNISNAQTVGYKAGETLFADQFFKALNPADPNRSGQGVNRQAIRRTMSYGTVQSSTNPLDMAITGYGMFRLTTPADPSQVYYTRNGQFGTDNQGNIVNTNGMYLTGFQATPDGTGISNLVTNLKMPAESLPPVQTNNSELAVQLDARQTAYLYGTANVPPFSPDMPSTYNSSTSQTVYDKSGVSHVLTSYFRRTNDENLTISRNPTTGVLSYSPSSGAIPGDPNSQYSVIMPAATKVTRESVTGSVYTVTLPDGTNFSMKGLIAGDTSPAGATFDTTTDPTKVAVTISQGSGTSALVLTYDATDVTSSGPRRLTTDTTVPYWNTSDAIPEDYVTGPKNGKMTINIPGVPSFTMAYSDMTLASGNYTINAGTTIPTWEKGDILPPGTLPLAASVAAGTPVSFASIDATEYASLKAYSGTLPDSGDCEVGYEFAVDSDLTAITSRYEIYASLDGNFYNAASSSAASATDIQPPTGSTGDYQVVGELKFLSGHNIDSLVKDAITGQPTFATKISLDGTVTDNGGADIDLNFSVDFSDAQNYGTSFAVTKSVQDGSSESLLTNVSVDGDGRLVGTYGNGKQIYSGQVMLANFVNTDGLIPSGNNVFAASALSGSEIVGTANSGSFGGVKGGSVEQSNVDLTSELVKLMIQQRMYQANSQSIKAFDDTLKTTIQMTS
jgi:flagellar hook protein FlgE